MIWKKYINTLAFFIWNICTQYIIETKISFPKTVPFESSQVEKFMTAIYRFFKCVDINGQGAFVVNSGEAVWVFSTVLDRQEIQRWNDWKLREAKKTQQCPWNRYKNLVIRKRQK